MPKHCSHAGPPRGAGRGTPCCACCGAQGDSCLTTCCHAVLTNALGGVPGGLRRRGCTRTAACAAVCGACLLWGLVLEDAGPVEQEAHGLELHALPVAVRLHQLPQGRVALDLEVHLVPILHRRAHVSRGGGKAPPIRARAGKGRTWLTTRMLMCCVSGLASGLLSGGGAPPSDMVAPGGGGEAACLYEVPARGVGIGEVRL